MWLLWVATLFIGAIIGAIIMFIGIAIGREMGRKDVGYYR